MGLDVHAITKYKTHENPRVDDADDMIKIYAAPHFPEHLCDLKEGLYIEVIEYGESHYHSGYGRHSMFRDFLASLVYEKADIKEPAFGDDDYENKSYFHRCPHVASMYNSEPELKDDFVALIHFSDCEGFIGNELCRVLLDAFERHDVKASNSEWYGKYSDFKGCLKDAVKSGGFLSFG